VTGDNDPRSGEPQAGVAARRHRPEIDGLRGVAVLVVLLSHAGFGFAGGYVGVDVFFVLSGYLIAEIAWRELRANRFSVVGFWERRARRILPALVVVGAVTLAAGWLVSLPDQYAALGRSVAAQAVFGANVHFWSITDYFARAAEVQPWLHTWSLAVEEQFYVVAPLLLLLLFRMRSARGVPGPALLAAVIAASFAWSVHAVARAPLAAFYLLPARAWELLLGVALALATAPGALLRQLDAPSGSRRGLRETAALVGLALIVGCALAYDKSTPFPGLAALPPCLGTALVLWATADASTVVGTLLARSPLRFVGLVSYSLYLWHWPLLALARQDTLAPPPVATRTALLVLSLLLASASWRLVETPFRERRVLPSRRGFALWAVLALGATLASGAVVAWTGGVPQRFAPEVLRLLDARKDRAFLRSVPIADVRSGKVVRIGAGTSDAQPRLLVWGDSHAMAALPAFDALLDERGMAGVAVVYVSTAPLVGFVREANAAVGLGEHAPEWADAVIAYATEHRIADVVLIANWSGYRSVGGARSTEVEAALIATVERLAHAGIRPWVLLQIPAQKIDVPEALARAAADGRDLEPLLAKPASPPSNGIADGDPDLSGRIVAAGGRVLDPRPRFLDRSGAHYVASSGDVVLYADSHHLTASGARATLLPLLRDAFSGW
jgi:peptidoglycan/LPS O-acetylase OafA/YrhL